MKLNFILCFIFLININPLFADFDVDEYKEFLKDNENMTYEELLEMYPAGYFKDGAETNFDNVEYADSIMHHYSLTDYEVDLINKNGFMVTDRIRYNSFMNAYLDVYYKDLPVYISSDAILHALHVSYASLFTEVEKGFYYLLDDVLEKIHNEILQLYIVDIDDVYKKAFNDLDIYFTVAKTLRDIGYYYHNNTTLIQNQEKVDEIIELIDGESKTEIDLFSDTMREIDFSQFKPRSYYANHYILEPYFKVMMWFGKISIVLDNKEGAAHFSDEDLHRMAILTAMIAQTVKEADVIEELKHMEDVFQLLIGKQDNISLFEVIEIMDEMNITADKLTDKDTYKEYLNNLLELKSANQLYSSQILKSNPLSPKQVEPPAEFLFFGQRPIIDSYVMTNVVYDKIIHKGTKVRRMIPKTTDVLFTLGNDAAIQLLEDEIQNNNYSSNLSGLRYLIDSYDNDFWDSSLYSIWLNSIRKLNPPENRDSLPPFMQTSAWWQKTMNTQLAGWAELRHDFLLYAKQGYTGDVLCMYPYGYVEPVPEFYENMKLFWEQIKSTLIDKADSIDYHHSHYIFAQKTYDQWMYATDFLISISQKILNKEELTDEENDFIDSFIFNRAGCGIDVGSLGWYPALYFGLNEYNFYKYREGKPLEVDKPVIADVHTIPTDIDGNEKGWVLHAGTGNPNLAIITVPTNDGEIRAYAGPVSSYFEYMSNNYERLNDFEWRSNLNDLSSRPDFTNLYLANNMGEKPAGEVKTLFIVPSTSVDEELEIKSDFNILCYPNPASSDLLIKVNIPDELFESNMKINIYNVDGELVNTLSNTTLYHKNYNVFWDGKTSDGSPAPSGTYLISVIINNKIETQKVIINRN